MNWKPDRERPVSPQIVEHICVQIASGALAPHERVPSVRDMAMAAGVNPNTVQRAYLQLEEQGVLYSVWGSGAYVCEDISVAKETVQRLTKERVTGFFADMKSLGLDTAAAKKIVEEWKL